jgi:hypothetical protein
MSYLERMCGPNFRHTKQYGSLVDWFVRMDAVSDEGPFEGLSAGGMKAVTASDLEAVVSCLDEQRSRDVSRSGIRGPDSDVTVALAAVRLFARSHLPLGEPGRDHHSDIARVVKGGMHIIRDTFICRTEASRVFGRLRFMRRSLGYEQDPEQVFT